MHISHFNLWPFPLAILGCHYKELLFHYSTQACALGLLTSGSMLLHNVKYFSDPFNYRFCYAYKVSPTEKLSDLYQSIYVTELHNKGTEHEDSGYSPGKSSPLLRQNNLDISKKKKSINDQLVKMVRNCIEQHDKTHFNIPLKHCS